MTTQEDWAFRAVHLRDAASRLEEKAKYLNALASSYRLQASRADRKANEPQEAKPGEMDEIERQAALLKTR